MNIEEFQKLTTDLLSDVENVGNVSNILVQLRDGFSEVFSENEKNKSEITKLSSDITSLRETNMQLYLKTGVATDGKSMQLPEEEKKENKLSFDDLFDINGNLK